MKLLCLLLLFAGWYSETASQVTTKTTIIRSFAFRYDSTSIVHDSAGNIIPYSTWSPLMATGDYARVLPSHSPDSNYFVLRRLTRREKEHAADLMPHRPSPNFPEGQPSFDFSGKSIDGRSFKSKELKGKIVVLHLSSFARYPAEELASYNELVDSFGTTGKLVFICLTPVRKADAKELLQGIYLRYAVIAGQEFFLKDAGIAIYPQDVVVDKDGNVAYSAIGKGNGTIVSLERKIKELLLVP